MIIGPELRHTLLDLFAGILVAGYAVAAVFFLRFWRASRDRLFLGFALALAILSLDHAALAVARSMQASQTALYVVRLAAFVLILWAIIDRNRRASRQ